MPKKLPYPPTRSPRPRLLGGSPTRIGILDGYDVSTERPRMYTIPPLFSESCRMRGHNCPQPHSLEIAEKVPRPPNRSPQPGVSVGFLSRVGIYQHIGSVFLCFPVIPRKHRPTPGKCRKGSPTPGPNRASPECREVPEPNRHITKVRHVLDRDLYRKTQTLVSELPSHRSLLLHLLDYHRAWHRLLLLLPVRFPLALISRVVHLLNLAASKAKCLQHGPRRGTFR